MIGFSATVFTEMKTLNLSTLAFLPSEVLNGELWRLFTPFCFFGGFGFPFVMNLFFLVRYSSAFEQNPYPLTPGMYVGTTADYAFALLFCAAGLLVIGWYFQFYFLGSALVFAVLYLWSKRNSETQVNFWGFNFKGAYLPFVLMFFSALMGASPVMDAAGVAAAHVFYFLVEVLPRKYNQPPMIQTPEWLVRLVDYISDTNTFNDTPSGRVAIPPNQRAAGIAGVGGHRWGPGRRLGGD